MPYYGSKYSSYKPTGLTGPERRRGITKSTSYAARQANLSAMRVRKYGSVARARGAAVTSETKVFDCDRTATAIAAVTTTWVAGTILDPGTTINLGSAAVATPACLFAPIPGSNLNNRVGRKCFVKKIKVKGSINMPAQATGGGDAGNVVRVVLVQDTQTNAAQMTGAQLFQDATAANTTINTFQNPNHFGRFRVLKDKEFSFNPLAITTVNTTDVVQAGIEKNFKFTVVFKKPVEVKFNATIAGTVGDIIDNSFHIIAGTDLSTGLVPTLSYYSRVTFTDP